MYHQEMEFNGAFQVKAISGEQRLDSRQGKRVDLVIPEFKVKPQVIVSLEQYSFLP